MDVEVVVARYCEPLDWLRQLPKAWRVTVYDKSQGGPRDRVANGREYGPNGPDAAPLWPGSIPLPNVGGEAHSYLTHICTRWESLAERTVFVQGDPLEHYPKLVKELPAAVRQEWYQFGPDMECDRLGHPHHPGLTQLADMADVFHVELPEVVRFKPWALFMASPARIRRVPVEQWGRARGLVVSKAENCAMERLWQTLLGGADADT
jgi:hypothetical protein